jgi:hypothetical protein
VVLGTAVAAVMALWIFPGLLVASRGQRAEGERRPSG